MLNFSDLEKKYRGDRCFILGNAPSLSLENLQDLKNEKVFICNKGYMTKNIGLQKYDFYVLGDPKQAEMHRQEILENISGIKFISSAIIDNYFKTDFIFYKRLGVQLFHKFPDRFQDGWGKTRTVVLDATIIAYFLGFSKIYLLGVDLDYSAENNHFYPDSDSEKRFKDKIPKRLPEIFSILEKFNNKFKKEKIDFVNLSQGFKYQDKMPVGKLKQIL